ncbi:protein XAP5 CIRCADIAN TIMEKEEPER-like [Silene latifolia]|uniref:protein XAP5 CIRCADIAN TIMEKEEPER-like n=1 Tax=Silene latifolia TaxID=37657 RepID=UPI003D778D3C
MQSEREAEEHEERERLKRQWVIEQEMIKNTPLQITYSYWDGRGHRIVIKVRKGDTIGAFLRAVQQQLSPDFHEVRTTSVENILYVKEDLIIPHQHSFYELIINKARGKSEPVIIMENIALGWSSYIGEEDIPYMSGRDFRETDVDVEPSTVQAMEEDLEEREEVPQRANLGRGDHQLAGA